MNNKFLLASSLLLLVSTAAFAEGGTCPDGYYPIGGQGAAGCAPIPGYGSSDFSVRTPTPVWEDRWGSIAADFQGGKFGIGKAMRSKQQAQDAAMADCKREGGGDCVIDLTYYNQCGVIAWGASNAATASAPTIEQAAYRALQVCGKSSEGCKIYHSDCSMPVRVQ